MREHGRPMIGGDVGTLLVQKKGKKLENLWQMAGGPVWYSLQETWIIIPNGSKLQGGAITANPARFARPLTEATCPGETTD